MVLTSRVKHFLRSPIAFPVAVLLIITGGVVLASGLSIGKGSRYDVHITEDGFVPDHLEIRQGDIVHFINNSIKPAWPASDPHPTHEFLNGFDPLHQINQDDSWEFTFSKAGEFGYHDHLLPHHRGSITVASRNLAERVRSLVSFNFRKSALPAEQSNGLPPEITQLLAEKDRSVQATIVHNMAEKYGPTKALEYMLKSGMVFTGETHLLVHQIGNVAYERYGEDALRYCNESFLSACYHGVILNELGDHGIAGVAKTIERCKEAGMNVFTQCAHAAGHGFLAFKEYHVLSALPLCDQLGKMDPQIPVLNCYDGVFMENIFGVHEGKPSPNRMVKASDPYYPCDAVPEKYRHGCWLDQATILFELFHGNLKKVAETCDGVKNSLYKSTCYDNFARQIHPLTDGKTDRAIELCDNATGTWKTTCLLTLVSAAFSVGDRKDMPYEICAYVSSKKFPQADSCYEHLFSMIRSYATTDQEFGNFCSFVREDDRRAECFKRFHVADSGKAASVFASGISSMSAPASGADIETLKQIIQQKGVRAAYAYLKDRWGANPVVAHDLAHLIGHSAYTELGVEGFSVCDENFSFGCFHGLLESLIGQKGAGAIELARNGCNALSPRGRVVSCIHGIGHGVLVWKYGNIRLALDVCGSLPPQEKPYCADGVFMEYYTGIMKQNNGQADVSSHTWDFCLGLPQEFQSSCVRNHILFLLSRSGDDPTSTIHTCDMLVQKELKESCVRSTGLSAAQRGHNSADTIYRTCSTFERENDVVLCMSAAAQEAVFQNMPYALAGATCEKLTQSASRNQCTQGIEEIRLQYGKH